MKSADAPLSSWFAKQKDAAASPLVYTEQASEISTLRLSLARADLDRVFTATLDLLSRPPLERSPERCAEIMRDWATCRSPKTTQVVGSVLLARLAMLPAEYAIPALPDVSLVEGWRKAAGLPVGDLSKFVLSDLERNFRFAVFDWLLQSATGDSEALRCLLDNLARAELAALAEARLIAFLSKDPKAAHLALLLDLVGKEPERMRRLVAVIDGEAELFVTILSNLPKLAGLKAGDVPLTMVIEALFAPKFDVTGRKRTRICALLARLGSELLLVERRSPNGEAALTLVAELGQQFRATAHNEEEAIATWLLTSAARAGSSGDELISQEGAVRWAFAFEESQQLGLPTGPLESLGRNLGLRPIVEPGTEFAFQPRWHEDTLGGLLPDTLVRAQTCGWQFQGRPIIRARVQTP